ncbi:hypothetical protein KEG38_31630 [Polyangium jinanense]|uniref:hypothetical protein n=1 Tax=Polyangium jinanense TaxID=2829994 RepID=UPI00233FA9EE|nr:hypothetical protein [Polyangium jinanense]MDC3958450.1 hypothetical protein [Polyangium jinanense]
MHSPPDWGYEFNPAILLGLVERSILAQVNGREFRLVMLTDERGVRPLVLMQTKDGACVWALPAVVPEGAFAVPISAKAVEALRAGATSELALRVDDRGLAFADLP